MNTQHTPGPWHSDFNGSLGTAVTINHPVTGHIITVANMNCGQAIGSAWKANCRLIASAPDLLAACQKTHDALFTIKMLHGHLSGSLRDSLTHHIGELSGVISKATGNPIPTPAVSENLNQPM